MPEEKLHTAGQSPSDESLKQLSMEKALWHIVAVLGPECRDCPENKCIGCRYDTNEALKTAETVLSSPPSVMLERLRKLEAIALVAKLVLDHPVEHNLNELREVVNRYFEGDHGDRATDAEGEARPPGVPS